MSQTKSTSDWGLGWIDSMAIGLSVLCAVHCLLTPVLLVLFPVIASTFWVERDFHLWMLFFVLPTTCIAIFWGCRKHRDRWIVFLSALGLSLLAGVAAYEVLTYEPLRGMRMRSVRIVSLMKRMVIHSATILNVLGGSLLALAHGRNFYLCRRLRCSERSGIYGCLLLRIVLWQPSIS